MLITMNWACRKGGFIIMGVIHHNSAHRKTVIVLRKLLQTQEFKVRTGRTLGCDESIIAQ